ncbi:MAG: hypothetical protein PHT40_03185 [Patescibacteria group bacterium]|nr:hypothetical protein [Patescibacteria group bacterium]
MSIFHRENSSKETLRWGIAAGVAEACYIGLVTLAMNGLNQLVSGRDGTGVFMPGFLLFLLFFVLSALISATLVFGRPMWLLMEKKLREAIATLTATILTLLMIFLAVVVLILVL